MLQRLLETTGKDIADFGCYFLSLLWCKECKEVSADSAFLYYKLFVAKGWMQKDCFIINPTAILEHLTGNKYKVKISTDYDNSDISIARYYNPKTGHYHFVVATPEKVLYDPLGYSNTVSEGYIESWRLFL